MNKIRKLIILAIVGLFFGAGGMPSLTGHQQNNDDAQLPIWEIGDSWTYDVFMNGGIDEKLELDDLHFSELEFMIPAPRSGSGTDFAGITGAEGITGCNNEWNSFYR